MRTKHEIWLLRHGETAWSLSGQHTGWTDLPLTMEGERQARELGEALKSKSFAAVYTSPLQRAARTCELAGLAAQALRVDNLREWNYGSVEGRTVNDLRVGIPDWSIWTHGSPDGESIEEVYLRAGRVIEMAMEAEGDVALFAHGHLFNDLNSGTWKPTCNCCTTDGNHEPTMCLLAKLSGVRVFTWLHGRVPEWGSKMINAAEARELIADHARW